MGTYTTNWNLLKPQGDPNTVDDFVDIESQINRNLKIVDDLGAKAVKYKSVDLGSAELPVAGVRNGDKAYNNFDGNIYVWSSSLGKWQLSKISSADKWTDITLASGFESVGGSNYNVSYSVSASSGNNIVRLRGRIRQTGYAVWTLGTVYNPGAAGVVPSPPANQYFMTSTSGNQPRFFRLLVSSTGGLEGRCFGSTAQTAGDAGNFMDLSGVSYSVMV